MKIGLLITLAVALFMSTMFVGVIATQVQSKTQLISVTDTFDLSPARLAAGDINKTYPFHLSQMSNDAWRQDYTECSLSTRMVGGLITVKNQTGDLLLNNGCDTGGYYMVDAVNTIYFCNNTAVRTSANGNTTTATYLTCPTEYLSGWSSNTLKLTPGLFVLMILGSCFVLVKIFEFKQD